MPQLEEVSYDKYKHLVSERALTGETMLLNMGPQHPSTHGVLRLLLELDGETIVNAIPEIGYLHTGVEKNMEAKTYLKAEVMTDRLDYMNTTGNNLAYCMAVEKLVDLDVPERAQVIRVIITELQRIASHLVFMGAFGLDLAAMSMFLYCFREREYIMDILELCSGQRMMTTYFRPGGVWRDVPVEFDAAVREFIRIFPKRVDEYEALLTKNPILLDRLVGIGILDPKIALSHGVTGPTLRASGVNWDLRKARPYMGYEQYDFNVPVRTEGDTFARYIVHIEEFRESLKIVEQGLEKLKKMPNQPVQSDNRKFVVPPRAEIGVSMEALIHHFKLWTEGFPAPKNSIYSAVESPRGELGVYLEGNGGPKPRRVHMRTPSFDNLSAINKMTQGHLVADLVAILASIDIVLGDIDR
ncbi:MAG: NADH-quinone oxidoreductase subunit 4 [Anaerolineales bacterium]|nr:NADH-quinone oxidoreductase subunit 4 [Anaerolineales bacterium]WKZ46421.1 MAG: NADH dehydrogenase (quinone) subunit D [Anaerolineales bacterium]